MTQVKYFAVKVAETLSLDAISEVLKVNRTLKWQDHIFVDNELVSMVLKQSVEKHEVHIYHYGVMTFVNFSEASIRIFLDFIGQIQDIKYESFAKYYDHYEASVGEYGEWFVKEDLTVTHKSMNKYIAETLAKSAGLSQMEHKLDRVTDSVEPMLNKLSKGRSRLDHRTMTIIAETIVFKYRLIQNLNLFERPDEVHLTGDEERAYRWLVTYFEYEDRYHINAQKIESLKHMVYQYYHFNQTRKVRSLYIFEVFLLTLFPLMSLLGDYIETLKDLIMN